MIYNIIVAIDLMDEKCVRLTQGYFSNKKIYRQNPLDMALILEDHGIKRIHIVDLDGARIGKIVHWNILEKIANKTKLIIDFGGGIKTEKDIKLIFDLGANIATIGSTAVTNPFFVKKIIEIYGNKKILVGVDVKNNKIATHGWLKLHDISLIDFLHKQFDNGVKQFFCTDIIKDGLLSGPSFSLYNEIIKKFPNIQLIASGGIRNLKDIKKLIKIGCSKVIVGKAIYENKIALSEFKKL